MNAIDRVKVIEAALERIFSVLNHALEDYTGYHGAHDLGTVEVHNGDTLNFTVNRYGHSWLCSVQICTDEQGAVYYKVPHVGEYRTGDHDPRETLEDRVVWVAFMEPLLEDGLLRDEAHNDFFAQLLDAGNADRFTHDQLDSLASEYCAAVENGFTAEISDWVDAGCVELYMMERLERLGFQPFNFALIERKDDWRFYARLEADFGHALERDSVQNIAKDMGLELDLD